MRRANLSQLRDVVARRGFGPADPGPAGVVDSLEAWVAARDAGGPARWVSVPLPEEAALGRAQTADPAGIPVFESALSAYRTLSYMRAATGDAAVLPEARLAGKDGLVVTGDGLVARESAWDDDKLHTLGLLARRRLSKSPVIDERVASLISQWCTAYYHWITDALPRLRILELTGHGELPLVVPADLTEWQRRSLNLLGVTPDRLVPYDGRGLHARSLVWPRPAATTGHTPEWACKWLRRRLVGEPTSGSRRLYLTRQRETQRRVSNEDELWCALESFGFEMVDPGSLPLHEQIAIFSEAAAIVSPHGGALTNLVFAEDATVIELFAPGYINPCFYALAERSGHNYWYLVASAHDRDDLHVDVAPVAETLRLAGILGP